MADESSASTLVLVGAILQLLAMLLFGALALFFLFGSALIYGYDPMNPILDFGWSMFWLFTVMGVLGLVFMILWFVWRSHPSRHRTGLVITGIIGLILAGFLPGLLALIGGAIAPSVREPQTPALRRQVTTPQGVKAVNYCPYCGTAIGSPAVQFCPTCGTRLT